MGKIEDFEKIINYTFKDKDLIKNALTHSSYANEKNLSIDNERLEFLGDSVLGFVTAEYLFDLYKKRPEGELTKLRAAIVCEKSLFKFSEKISLGEFLYMGKGEENSGGRNRPSILSDAFEAVIAAMYLDGGIDAVKPYILQFVSEAVKREANFKDNKSLLQEEIQKTKGNTIVYEELSESGPDHEKVFSFAVRINGKVVGTGDGRSKKEAEQAAAGDALAKLEI